MALILSLESSTTVCSAALHEDGDLIETRETQTPQAAASQLTVLVDQLFSSKGIKKSALAAVAVSGGPGSYTGLRIGAATAKGICYTLNLPLIAIDSLHVLASSAPKQDNGRILCPMIDARRMEVYCCLLNGEMIVVEETHAKIIDEQAFADRLSSHTIVFLGNGSDKCRDMIRHPNAVFLQGTYPKASAMGRLAFHKFGKGDFADVSSFEPAYLKEFVVKTKKT